jgi:hypothetical protein
MNRYERERYTIDRKLARLQIIDPLIAKAPKRKTKGNEITHLIEVLIATHDMLVYYDSLDEAAAVAGSAETTFDMAVERLTAALAPPAQPTST